MRRRTHTEIDGGHHLIVTKLSAIRSGRSIFRHRSASERLVDWCSGSALPLTAAFFEAKVHCKIVRSAIMFFRDSEANSQRNILVSA